MGEKEYDNNMQGVLFKNDKRTTDRHPHYTGSAEIEKKEYWVSAWVKTARSGKKYMSLAYTAKDQPAEVADDVDLDEDMPF